MLRLRGYDDDDRVEREMTWTLTIDVAGAESHYTFEHGFIAHLVCDGYDMTDPPRPYRLMGPDGIRANLSATDSTVSHETHDLLEVR